MKTEPPRHDQPLLCGGCLRVSEGDTLGWRAYRVGPSRQE